MKKAKINPKEQAKLLFNEGKKFINKKSIPEAIKKFDEAINIYPNLQSAWVKKGKLLVSQGDVEAAYTTYIEIKKKFPNLTRQANEQITILYPKYAEIIAFKKFDGSLKKNPELEAAWLKGDLHMERGELAEAYITFEEIKKAFSYMQESVDSKLKYIRLQINTLTHEDLSRLNSPTELWLRKDFCTLEYQTELDQLCEQHAQIKLHDFSHNVNWIIRLIDFCFKYYNKDENPMPFVNSSLIELTSQGRENRAHIVGNRIAPLAGIRYPDLSFHEQIEVESAILLDNLRDDIFLDDSKKVMRMIFETIHQLPREDRAKLLEFLPWGPNSWYLLEFCSTFFRDNQNDAPIPFVYNNSDELEAKSQYREFQKSLQADTCLVKAVIPDLLKNDLPKLHLFFSSIKANLLDSSTHKVLRLEELSNLRPLLWYFKHSYFLSRLAALTPPCFNVSTVLFGNNRDSVDKSPFMELLSLPNTENFVHDLKSKLTFIRRISLIGEIFTRRNWGTQLDSIDYIDVPLLTAIRNGLSHPEDTVSSGLIYNLESDNSRLIKLYQELNTLRAQIYLVIKNRQMNFPAFPNTDVPNRVWQEPMYEYWNAVKGYYKLPDVFDIKTFVSSSPLLDDAALNKLISGMNGNSAVYDTMCDMLKGKIPFRLPSGPDIKTLVQIGGIKEKFIKKVMKTADKAYNLAMQQIIEQKANARRREEEKLLAACDASMKNNYPELREVAISFIKQLYADDNMSIGELISFLKSRFNLLKQLFTESSVDFESEAARELIKSKLLNNVELFFSCSYLVSQIISILNRLNGLDVMEKINSTLVSRLPEFVALRNALEHNDPVIDSGENNFIQMQSHSNIILAQVAHELIDSFYDDVACATPSLLTEFPDNPIKLNMVSSRSKQLLPIDVSAVEYPKLEKMPIHRCSDKASYLFFNTPPSKGQEKTFIHINESTNDDSDNSDDSDCGYN